MMSFWFQNRNGALCLTVGSAGSESRQERSSHVGSELNSRLSPHVRWRVGRANLASLSSASQCARSSIATTCHLASKAVPCPSGRCDGHCEKVGEGTQCCCDRGMWDGKNSDIACRPTH